VESLYPLTQDFFFFQYEGLCLSLHTVLVTVISSIYRSYLPILNHSSGCYKSDVIFKFLSIITSSLTFSIILAVLCYLSFCFINFLTKLSYHSSSFHRSTVSILKFNRFSNHNSFSNKLGSGYYLQHLPCPLSCYLHTTNNIQNVFPFYLKVQLNMILCS